MRISRGIRTRQMDFNCRPLWHEIGSMILSCISIPSLSHPILTAVIWSLFTTGSDSYDSTVSSRSHSCQSWHMCNIILYGILVQSSITIGKHSFLTTIGQLPIDDEVQHHRVYLQCGAGASTSASVPFKATSRFDPQLIHPQCPLSTCRHTLNTSWLVQSKYASQLMRPHRSQLHEVRH